MTCVNGSIWITYNLHHSTSNPGKKGSRRVRRDQHYVLNRKVRKAFIFMAFSDIEIV